MQIVPKLAKSLTGPLIVALVILTTSTAFALGAGCVGCQTAPDAAPVMIRVHVPARSLLVAPVAVPQVRNPAPARPLRAPTRFPAPDSGDYGIWSCIARYESGSNWSDNSGGFEGGLQFLNSTWLAAGGGRYAQHAYDATPAQQVEIARGWLAQTSWNQWPQTSRMCGVR